MQELVYLVMTTGNFEDALKLTVRQRGPFLEMKIVDGHDGVAAANSAKRPRQLKTHLQYKFFERTFKKQKPRVIIVMRNLKVSCHGKMMNLSSFCFSFKNSFFFCIFSWLLLLWQLFLQKYSFVFWDML